MPKRAALEQVEGVVFDIQRYSVHDGPGLRTNVFLKGCPLRCGWCANPESQRRQPELALNESNCITCGQYDVSCPDCWSGAEQNADNITLVEELGERIDVCPTGAVHWIGRTRMAGDVIAEVLRDRPFYGEVGGLTVTGGEPTMQPLMAEALLRLAKSEGISTAIETSGYTHWPVFERLLPHLDTILYDVKHVDDDIHQRHAGVSNALILENLRRLIALGAPVIVRIPLIPGFNADAPSLNLIAESLLTLDGLRSIDLLPYHSMGKAKYESLGMAYPWDGHNRLDDAQINSFVDLFKSIGFQVRVGG